ncbi:MAG: hypothetical protein FWF02_05810 [Micrococcales bacterium]|nr:hypothetical protein [Micrococcales bacterium]
MSTNSPSAGLCDTFVVPPTPTPAPTSAGTYETTSHTFTVRGLNPDPGYGWTWWDVTITVGPWLPGSEPAALDDAWQQVSRRTPVPLTSGKHQELGRSTRGFDPLDDLPSQCLDSSQAAFLFGTIAFDRSERGEVSPERRENPPHWLSEEVPQASLLIDPDTPGRVVFVCYTDDLCGYTETGPGDKREPFEPGIILGDSVFHLSVSAVHPFVVAVPDVMRSPDGYAQLSGFTFLLEAFAGIEPCEPTGWCGKTRAPIPTQVGWEQP